MTVPAASHDGSAAAAAAAAAAAEASPPSASPVTVSLRALTANSLPLQTLTDAFGPSSLGIILVKDLPPQFAPLRLKLLQYASYLAHLPAAELERLTVPEAKYLTGWSHGVETLRSGKKDSLKGSWYSNCSFYHDRSSAIREGAWGNGGIDAKVAELALRSEVPERQLPPGEGDGSRDRSPGTKGVRALAGAGRVEDFPEYTSPNVWPEEDLLPGFRKTLEDLCCLIIDVAVLVAKQCDRFAEDSGIDGYDRGYLERVVSTSRTTKARLLHYFPPPAPSNGADGESVSPDPLPGQEQLEDDDWCTTHKDHGCLTGLTSALFVDESDPEPVLRESPPVSAAGDVTLPPLSSLKGSPDPAAGLYIRSRTGALTKVAIPSDCLAFQTGEALERVTKGKFAAVPHFVRGPRLGGGGGGGGVVDRVARNTLAVFTQPNLGENVDDRGTTFAQFAREIVDRNTAG